jgi:hypothetical protein
MQVLTSSRQEFSKKHHYEIWNGIVLWQSYSQTVGDPDDLSSDIQACYRVSERYLPKINPIMNGIFG